MKFSTIKCISIASLIFVFTTDGENGIDKLETIINVSDFEIPNEIKTNYNCYMKGNSKFDFDLEKATS